MGTEEAKDVFSFTPPPLLLPLILFVALRSRHNSLLSEDTTRGVTKGSVGVKTGMAALEAELLPTGISSSKSRWSLSFSLPLRSFHPGGPSGSRTRLG